VTFPDATGVARVHGFGNVALIHFDAHADTGETHFGHLYGHGTPMRRLIESGAVPGNRFVQIGLRGYWPGPETFAWMKDQGMRSYMMSEITDRGLNTVVDEAVTHAADGADAVFLSIDIDVVDPGMAPGTGTPEPGGLTSRELLDTVRRLAKELNIVGADVVEVSPPYDGPGEITAYLANRVVLEILNGMAERKVAGDS
jgi:agmatinase